MSINRNVHTALYFEIDQLFVDDEITWFEINFTIFATILQKTN
jgi:hypothetical protein